jgi:hypothetical protein
MKKLLTLLALIQLSLSSYSQMVARAEIKEKIEGICDIKNVYTLFPMFGDQVEAVPSVSEASIEEKLNKEVAFLKENPKYDDKGMVSIIINCKGEVVQCKIDNETKSQVLDDQIVQVFKTVSFSKPGKLNGKKVDSLRLWSFEIKKGKLTLN